MCAICLLMAGTSTPYNDAIALCVAHIVTPFITTCTLPPHRQLVQKALEKNHAKDHMLNYKKRGSNIPASPVLHVVTIEITSNATYMINNAAGIVINGEKIETQMFFSFVK